MAARLLVGLLLGAALVGGVFFWRAKQSESESRREVAPRVAASAGTLRGHVFSLARPDDLLAPSRPPEARTPEQRYQEFLDQASLSPSQQEQVERVFPDLEEMLVNHAFQQGIAGERVNDLGWAAISDEGAERMRAILTPTQLEIWERECQADILEIAHSINRKRARPENK
jgi:hypothetical protein